MKPFNYPIPMKHAILALSVLALAACGGGETPAPATEETPAETAAPAVPEVAEITIEANDQMKYNLDRIEVYAGQTVKLTLKNVGQLPKEAMGHNWTLLASGVAVEDYGAAALAFKDNEYQDPSRTADVIIATKLLGPGESETIEFKAPEKGVYRFLCTFPGHFGLMNGKFVVK
jgi:azurin